MARTAKITHDMLRKRMLYARWYSSSQGYRLLKVGLKSKHDLRTATYYLFRCPAQTYIMTYDEVRELGFTDAKIHVVLRRQARERLRESFMRSGIRALTRQVDTLINTIADITDPLPVSVAEDAVLPLVPYSTSAN
jgi:hypothetical protein